MVEGRWAVAATQLITEEQKLLIQERLANRITASGFLLVKSQAARTQQGNKEEVIRKMNELVNAALVKKKARIATKTPKAIKERILENKKQKSAIKQNRRRIRPGEF